MNQEVRNNDSRSNPERPDVYAGARLLGRQWRELCARYLPLDAEGGKWRYSRVLSSRDPDQGWKLHLSATVLTANEVLRKVAPFLHRRGVAFKAPASLDELSKINCGLYYGYSQVGKFITVYPRDDGEAVAFARQLHKLTRGMAAPSVPFDQQFRAGSCVYYRYGAFRVLEIKNADGVIAPALRAPDGKLIPDSRESEVMPIWAADPFVLKQPRHDSPASPLKTTFRAFRALSQRGKGGVYQAIDLSANPPRLCILKEGRRSGETGWDGRDGYWRVRNEEISLHSLQAAGVAVPRIYASFAAGENYYLATEFIEGQDLRALLSLRQRRLAVAQALAYAISIARLVARIHAAGWAWRDCKPHNLIVTKTGELRPLDFEGACPLDHPHPLEWHTPDFSPPEQPEQDAGERAQSRAPEDLYALGATIYFLLTGRLPTASQPVPMTKLRRNLPASVCQVTAELLAPAPQQRPGAMDVACRLEAVLLPTPWPGKDSEHDLESQLIGN